MGLVGFFQSKTLHHINNKQAADCVMTMPSTSDSKFKLKTCLIGSRTFEHLDACTYVEHNHPLYNPLDVAHTLGRVRDKVLHPNHTSKLISLPYGQSQKSRAKHTKEILKKMNQSHHILRKKFQSCHI